MNLVRFHEPVTLNFRKSAGGVTATLDAHRDFVFSNAQLERILQEESVKSRFFKISRMDNIIPNFDVRIPKKTSTNRVLVYNGSGGYGDQILTWPFTLILHRMGYEVHVACDPGNQMCWWHMPWIKSISTFPMQADHFWMFDHFACYDAICNIMEHPNHPNPLDVLLAKVGIDPESIPAKDKVVRPMFTTGEMAATQPFQDKQIALYQFASANQVRNLPPADSAYILGKLCEAFPQYLWLGLYDEFIPRVYLEAAVEPLLDADKKQQVNEKQEPLVKVKYPNAVLYSARNLRELWAVASIAKVIVAPDSLMVHVAGCLGIPCVGMWGPYCPESRVTYYTNHYPIHNKAVCPLSPCNHYLATFPRYCPPRANRNVCEVMAAISPKQVIDGIHALVPESRAIPIKKP